MAVPDQQVSDEYLLAEAIKSADQHAYQALLLDQVVAALVQRLISRPVLFYLDADDGTGSVTFQAPYNPGFERVTVAHVHHPTPGYIIHMHQDYPSRPDLEILALDDGTRHYTCTASARLPGVYPLNLASAIVRYLQSLIKSVVESPVDDSDDDLL